MEEHKEPSEKQTVDRAKVFAAGLDRTKLKQGAIGISALMVMFPPWVTIISRNGVTAKFDAGFHPFWWDSGRQLFSQIDFSQLVIQVALVWLVYWAITAVGSQNKKEENKND